MCESEIYLIEKNKEIMADKGTEWNEKTEKIMGEVVFVNVEGNKISLSKMFGEEKELNGYRIVTIDLLNHRILIEKI